MKQVIPKLSSPHSLEIFVFWEIFGFARFSQCLCTGMKSYIPWTKTCADLKTWKRGALGAAAIYYSVLYCITLHNTVVHYTILQYTTLHCSTLYYVTLYYTALYWKRKFCKGRIRTCRSLFADGTCATSGKVGADGASTTPQGHYMYYR